jgi:hypothetical protein
MQDLLKQVMDLRADEVCRSAQGFAGTQEEIEKLKWIQEELRQLGETFGDNLPVYNLDEAKRLFGLTHLREALDNLRTLAQRRFEDQRTYASQLSGAINNLSTWLKPVIHWCSLFASGPAYDNLFRKQSEIEKTVDDKVAEAKQFLVTTYEKTLSKANEIQELLRQAQDAAQKVKVAHLEKVYGFRVSQHQKASRCWLYGTIGGGLLLMVLAVSALLFDFPKYLGFDKDQNHWLSILIFATCLVPILAILGLTNLCAKRASAHSHLAAVYEHKASIARAFLWMSEAEKDDKLRAEWMRKIVEGLVSFESSGFLGKESGSGAPQPITLQVFKEAAELAKGGGNPPVP